MKKIPLRDFYALLRELQQLGWKADWTPDETGYWLGLFPPQSLEGQNLQCTPITAIVLRRTGKRYGLNRWKTAARVLHLGRDSARLIEKAAYTGSKNIHKLPQAAQHVRRRLEQIFPIPTQAV